MKDGEWATRQELRQMEWAYRNVVGPWPGEPNIHPIPYVVAHWDPSTGKLDPGKSCKISMDQILTAIGWWSNSTSVPLTGDKTMDMNTILNLISMWSEGVCIEG